MRLTLALLLSMTCFAATRTPCPGGPGVAPCDTAANTRVAIQAQIDAAVGGDVIELQAGSYPISSRLVLPKRSAADTNYVTIRTASYTSLPAAGYRLRDADKPLLAILYATGAAEPVISTKSDYQQLQFTQEPFSLSLSGAGNTVLTVGAGCSVGSPCKLITRDGTTRTFTAPVGSITLNPTLPGSGFATIGIDNAGKLTIGWPYSSGMVKDTQFGCPNCGVTFDRYWSGSTEYEPNSVPIANKTYGLAGWSVDGTWTGNYWASTRIFTTGPWAAGNGYGIIVGEAPYTGAAAGSHHYRFQGIGFATPSRTFQYWLVGIGVDSLSFYDYRDMPHHFEFDQCLFTGEREYPTPAAALRLRAENVTVKNSLFRWIGVGGQDSQDIAISDDCPGPLLVENNDLDAATENVMAGGSGAILAGYVPSATYRRNYIWKRLDHRTDFDVRRNANTAILEWVYAPGHLASIPTAPLCDAANTECRYWYDETVHAITQNTYVTLSGGVSGQAWIGLHSTGVYLYHNMSADNVTCSGQVTCVAGATSLPDGYAFFAGRVATSGAWGGSESPGRRFQKNLWECKNCKDTVVEGNVFSQYWNDGQQFAFALTPRNQNGASPWVRMDNIQVRRNKVLGIYQGINVLGVDDGGLQTYVKDVVFSHNLFADIGAPRWIGLTYNSYTSGVWSKVHTRKAWLETYHNTVRLGGPQLWVGNSAPNADPNLGATIISKYNVFTANASVEWSAYIGTDSAGSGWNAVAAYNGLNAASAYTNNLNAWGATGSQYPAGNYVAANATGLFTDATTPGALTDNLRIPAVSPWSAHCTSGCSGPSTTDGSQITADGLDLGADVDWVESLTDGVVEGSPPLATRWGLTATATSNTVTLSLANGTVTQAKLASHQNMRASNVVRSAAAPDSVDGGTASFAFTGLTPNTTYWYTATVDGATVKDSITLPDGPAPPAARPTVLRGVRINGRVLVR